MPLGAADAYLGLLNPNPKRGKTYKVRKRRT